LQNNSKPAVKNFDIVSAQTANIVKKSTLPNFLFRSWMSAFQNFY